jgi:hypothetical protein
MNISIRLARSIHKFLTRCTPRGLEEEQELAEVIQTLEKMLFRPTKK